MAQDIRESQFQKQHAEAMQALIWAISQDSISEATINEISRTHAKALEEEEELASAWALIIAQKPDDAIALLKQHEKDYHEDLNRKASRHKLSIFFALLFAIGCGATIAGSDFLIGLQYGWIKNIGFLSAIAILAFPIIGVVGLANWWLGVRSVPDLENQNKDPYLLLKNRFGEPNSLLKRVFFAVGIVGIEIYSALVINFKTPKKAEENRSPFRYFWYLTALIAAVIYGFFAFAAIYNLGLGIHSFLMLKGVVGSDSLGAAAIGSAVAGIVAAVPTYMTMRIIYLLNAAKWFNEGEGPFDQIRKIPGWEENNLLWKFGAAAVLIITGVAFTTYAAVTPFAHWLQVAGMTTGVFPLAYATIAIAFIGNIPFYINTAARSFKQYYDPRQLLQNNNSKWFPYVRFWNATLNAIPAIVGVLAFFGMLGLSGPLALAIPVIVNVVVAAAASYFANSGGSPTMYQFDPAKQISKYQQLRLNQLKNLGELDATLYPDFLYEDELETESASISIKDQLNMEFVGAYVYAYEADRAAKMPPLAIALHKAVNGKSLSQVEQQLLYKNLTTSVLGRPSEAASRLGSAFFHSNVRYTNSVFPYDYLRRIEDFADDKIKKTLYDAAITEGNGIFCESFRSLLSIPLKSPGNVYKLKSNDYVLDNDAPLFWKAYDARESSEQRAIIHAMQGADQNKNVRELLLKHSKPEVRKELMKAKVGIDSLAHGYMTEKLSNQGNYAYQLFKKENRLELIPFAGFMLKNLAFPLVMVRYAYNQIFANVPFSMSFYNYLTEGADDNTRQQFICDVLMGYAAANDSKSQLATKLYNIIKNPEGEHTLDQEDLPQLRSGFLGRILQVCSTLPVVKMRLIDALDKCEAGVVKQRDWDAIPTDDEPTSSFTQKLKRFVGWENTHSSEKTNKVEMASNIKKDLNNKGPNL
jgi:sterol desaturase/sphingolipid hydroxylase (fatty acid hydroxylase superfamily)